MQQITSNPCSRCGKERVLGQVWVEEVEAVPQPMKLTHTMMICPDAECQAKLEEELAQLQLKRDERAKLKEEQSMARRQYPVRKAEAE